MGARVRRRCVSPFPFPFLADLLFAVEFDIDTGPTVDGLYPPLTLHPSEKETMYTYFSPGLKRF
jgi:hypothetical protein